MITLLQQLDEFNEFIESTRTFEKTRLTIFTFTINDCERIFLMFRVLCATAIGRRQHTITAKKTPDIHQICNKCYKAGFMKRE